MNDDVSDADDISFVPLAYAYAIPLAARMRHFETRGGFVAIFDEGGISELF